MPLPSLIDLFENALTGQVFDPNRFNQDQKTIQDTVNEIINDLVRHYGVDGNDHDLRYYVKAYIDATFATKGEVSGVVLGQIPPGTLTENSMANEMKKQTGGVSPYIERGTASLPTAGWVANTGDYAYKYNLAITGVLSTHVVNVAINKDDLDIAQSCEMASTNESYAGGVTFFAKTVPTATIGVGYTILK